MIVRGDNFLTKSERRKGHPNGEFAGTISCLTGFPLYIVRQCIRREVVRKLENCSLIYKILGFNLQTKHSPQKLIKLKRHFMV